MVCWNDTQAKRWWVRFFLPGRGDNGQGRRGRTEAREREREEEGDVKWCRHGV